MISQSQSKLVKGRQIMGNILIANEVVDEANKPKKYLTMFKAYDLAEWEFLDYVIKLNFQLNGGVGLRRWSFLGGGGIQCASS